MSLQSHIEFLNQMEDEYDVWSWQFEGIHYWPLLRIHLWSKMVAEFSAKPAQKNIRPASKAKAGDLKPKKSIVQTPPALLTANQLRKRVFSSFPKRQSSDILLLSRHIDAIDCVEGEYHDRLVDPIWRLAKKTGLSVKKIQVIVTAAQLTNKKLAVPSAVIEPDSFGLVKETIDALPELTGLVKKAQDIGIDFALNDGVFRSLLRRTLTRSIVFEVLLDVYQPKLVMLGVFYDPFFMAAVLACRRRGIKIADIQHGKQGIYHGAFNSWHHIPAGGSQLLPDYFWAWGEQTAKRIEIGMAAQADHHRPYIAGNVWLGEWKNKQHHLSDHAKDFFAAQAHFEKRILVSLQPIKEPLPETLLKAMEISPKKWVWWFRLHPKQRSNIDFFKKRIMETGASFEMEEPCDLPLYPLILKADYHLTGWSTVAFEAEALGCKTALFHPLGYSILAPEITEQRFLYAKNGEELIEIIIQNKKTDTSQPPGVTTHQQKLTPYIETQPALAQKALRDMLHQTNQTNQTIKLARLFQYLRCFRFMKH